MGSVHVCVWNAIHAFCFVYIINNSYNNMIYNTNNMMYNTNNTHRNLVMILKSCGCRYAPCCTLWGEWLVCE